MSDEIRVSSVLVRALSEAVQGVGVDSRSLFARSNVDFHAVDSVGWVQVEEFDALLRNAVAITGDLSFGLHWAERSPMFQLDRHMSLIMAAPTLRDAIDALIQTQLLFANREQCSFTELGRRALLSFDLLCTSEVGKRVMTEFALGGVSRTFHYRGELRALRRINVAYGRPLNSDVYTASLPAQVHFNQPQTSVEFVSSALDRQYALSNEGRYKEIRLDAERLQQRVLGSLSCAEQLEGQIRSALPRVLSMQEIARANGMSERSLRRKLAEEGVRFAELVDDLQRKRAHELLQAGGKTVKEVAAALGFSNSSGFIRAYRRWTGRSPGLDATDPQWRKR